MFITNLFDLRFLHYFYPDTSEFNVGTGLGMPGCSYATAICCIRPSLQEAQFTGGTESYHLGPSNWYSCFWSSARINNYALCNFSNSTSAHAQYGGLAAKYLPARVNAVENPDQKQEYLLEGP